MPHRRRPRAIRRRVLGCERLEPRSMFAVDAGMLDVAFPVDAPSPCEWAVDGDTVPPALLDTGTVGDGTPIDATDDFAFVVFNVLADDGTPPDGISIDGISIDAHSIDPYSMDASLIEACSIDAWSFDGVATDGGFAIDEMTPEFGPGEEASEQESEDFLPLVWFDSSALPQPVAILARASANGDAPAIPDAGFLAWAGLVGDRAAIPAQTSQLPTAAVGGGSIAPESWARIGTPADHPAPLAAIDHPLEVVDPSVALPADEPPASPASGLGERVSPELPRALGS